MDFNLGDLFAAIDAHRQARGLNWAQAVREINRRVDRAASHPMSRSTVTGLRTRARAEGDGVLQMLRWLNRTPESFVPDCGAAVSEAVKLPEVASHQILRFDTTKLHSALDQRRIGGGMTWKQVAREVGGVNAASLTYLSKGGRIGFPLVMRITRWLGQPAACFTRAVDR